jgi:hypothetical protein
MASTQVPKEFEGGSDTFFSLVYTSQVSSYESLEPFLHISPIPARLSGCFLGRACDLPGILTDFLKGSGIPCPHLFEEAKQHFASNVDLAAIDTPGFRSRILCWAISGSPSIQVDGSPIEVHHCFQFSLASC